jgi:ATP-dependent phosphofructokinase / diphosphate-dependent phosphofructokinase
VVRLDAATTDKWYFVTIMGRHARHLALGIGSAAGATLTIIEHGVALLAEGLIERLDPETLNQIERDPYGNVRLAELELSRLLKQRVAASLGARGIATSIVAKDIGYELRCAPPGGFDIHYCRGLGYWATRFLLEGGTEALVTLQGDAFVPVPFRELIDAKTGRFRVRHVDVKAAAYQMLAAYMIRLTRADLEDPEQLRALARAGALDEATLLKRFGR